jgi:hypothetical protein
MTDGIVQKVLLNWYHKIQSNDRMTEYPKLIFPSDMTLLEQELIEEIKKRFNVNDSDVRIIVMDLIGDNE